MKKNRFLSTLTAIIMMFTIFQNLVYVKVSAENEIQAALLSKLYNGSGGSISCDFDGYVNTSGRHEGIDCTKNPGAAVYSIINGEVINVVETSGSLSTLAIYDSIYDKTVIYLHTANISVSIGQRVSQGQQVATESNMGATAAHTHVEVRDGKRTLAAKSVNDYTLENSNPYPYLNSVLISDESSWVQIANFKISDEEWTGPFYPNDIGNTPVYYYGGIESEHYISYNDDCYIAEVYQDQNTGEVFAHVDYPVGDRREDSYYVKYDALKGVPSLQSQQPDSKITKVAISNIAKDTFRVEIDVTNSNGLTSVKVPSWSNKNGMDDVVWHPANKYTDTHWFADIKTSAHNNDYGDYSVDVYLYNGETVIDAWKGENNKRTTASIGKYKIVLNTNGGTVSPETKDVIYNEKVGSLPTPNKRGYSFVGWYTGDGTNINANSIYNQYGNLYLYARWSANEYTLTYDANGGTVSPASVKIKMNAVYSLPTPTRADYNFDGWYTEKTGGTKITSGSNFIAGCNQTLYAHWTAIPVTTTTSNITTKATTTTSTTTSATTTTTTTIPQLSIKETSITLKNGEQYTIKANQQNLKYSSNNTDVAVVSKKGVVTAIKEGNAVISVINEESDVVQLKVTVVPAFVSGDCNNDGELSIADAVLLKKWLHGGSEKLVDWKAADLCEDGQIDIFDLIIMKQMIIKK